MKPYRLIILAWLLLLLPTLLLGAGALHLLRGEEQRLRGQTLEAAAARVRSITESIDLAVIEVEEGLLQTLRRFDPADLLPRLEAWQQGNPLVRNVFIWREGEGLQFPPPNQPGNAEEAAFIQRYQALFSGEDSWEAPEADRQPSPAPLTSYASTREELRSLAQQAPTEAAVADAAAKPVEPAGRGGVASVVLRQSSPPARLVCPGRGRAALRRRDGADGAARPP